MQRIWLVAREELLQVQIKKLQVNIADILPAMKSTYSYLASPHAALCSTAIAE